MTALSALRTQIRMRAALKGIVCCTACDSPGPHTMEQCKARRPLCHLGCGRRTCIQARTNGCAPTCLDHFFEKSWKQETIDPEIGIFVRRRGKEGTVGLVVNVGAYFGMVEVRWSEGASTLTSPVGFWDRWQRSEIAAWGAAGPDVLTRSDPDLIQREPRRP